MDEIDSIDYMDVTLETILNTAMQNDAVLRDLGGTILRNPETIRTHFNNALTQTDPRFGMEAALSSFDAQLNVTAFFANNDQTYNNPFFAGGTNTFKQDEHDYTTELSKLTATGTRLALRNVTNYDSNNAPGNIFPNAWDTYVEGEVRKPLLQGAGLTFNRVAGPGGTPGVYNGVLIARVNNDISQTDFEIAVRDYVSNVTNAYWDLYFAYRDFGAKTEALQRALHAYNKIGQREGESPSRKALVAEQYFQLKQAVDEAMSGQLVQGTQVRNGSSGGTLRGGEGIQVAERRLRLLIGMPVADGQMLRPIEEPQEAQVVFDYHSCTNEAKSRRPELRKQQLRLHQREMELVAAKNFLNPRLDAVGRYRFRGFGDDLISHAGGQNASAVSDLVGGDLQEWFVGMELNIPIGYRRAHLAVQNAELMIHRERAIHNEQGNQVGHDVINAIADAERAYLSAENNLNRYLSAREVVKTYEIQEEEGAEVDIENMLDAQRRLMDANVNYYRARTEYAVALKNVHFEKGSLMDYSNLGVFDGSTSTATDTHAQNAVVIQSEVLQSVDQNTEGGEASLEYIPEQTPELAPPVTE